MPLPSSPKALGDILSDYNSKNDLELADPKPAEKPAAPPRGKARAEAKQAALLTAPKAPRAPKKSGRSKPAAAAGKPSPKKPSAAKKPAADQAPGFAPLAAQAQKKVSPLVVRRRRARMEAGAKRLFALDTNVLLHDPSCLFRFEEHDVFLPITSLEELDRHKTGMSDVARNARQVSRTIDQLMEAAGYPDLNEGIPLNALGNREATGRLYCQTRSFKPAGDLPGYISTGNGDNEILKCVAGLAAECKDRTVVLVSKDINMRIKAATLGLPAEDYFNDKAIDDTDLLYTGKLALPSDFWETHGSGLKSWQKDGSTWYRVKGPLVRSMFVNEFVYTEGAPGGFEGIVASVDRDEAVFRSLRSYTQPKNAVWGITARNRDQNFALNLLLNPEIDFVTLLGQAGTGKTLLTLAAALTQTLDERRYTEIIFTRATVSVGEDIGFLPGTEEEKMLPWMGALDDNLEVLNRTDPASGSWGHDAAADLIRSRIRVKSMSFMRGRTFQNRFLIIDEAQNLSPKQMKTLITRAGPGTKIVCMGNISQIDTPYLTEGSSGLTFVVDRFKGWAHAGHITLERGERSRLADFASSVL
ncbi:MAG: PhoH family protein [Mesosutterella sp.]|nr:PhoH family protein [Mesosutterella sp.]